MPGTVRTRMIEGALQLLSQRGLQSTSFAQVTQATQTPRGSIYHHFPGGKQELVLEALDASVRVFDEAIAPFPTDSPEAFVEAYMNWVRSILVESDFATGSAVAAVTLAAENSEQLERCATVQSAYVASVAERLRACGVTDEAADSFAVIVVVSSGGATTMGRASRSCVEFDLTARRLVDDARGLPRA